MAEPFCDANYPTRTTTPIGISHLFPSSDDIIVVEPKQVIQSFSPIGSPVDPSKLKADTRDMQSYDLFCSDSLNISHLINAMSPLQLQQNAGWKAMQDRSYFVTRANLPQDAASRFASSLPQHASTPIFSTQIRSRSFSASSVQKPSVSSNASVNTTTTVHMPTPEEETIPSVPPPQEELLLSNSNKTDQNQIPEPDPSVDAWMEEWLTGMGGMELELEGSGGRLKKGAVLLSPIKKEVPSSVAVASPAESVGLNVGNFLFNLNPQITDSSRPANANQFSAPGDMSRFSPQTIQRTTHQQQPIHSMSNFAEPLVGNSSNPFITTTRQTSPLVPRHRHDGSGEMRSSHESKILNPYAVAQTQPPPSPPASPTLLRLSHASLDNKAGSPRNYQPSSSITRPLNTCVVRGRAISNGSTNAHITSLSAGAEGSDGSDVDSTTTISTRARSRSRSKASSRLSARSSHGRAFPSPELLRVKRGKSAAPDESQGFLFHHQPWPSPDATKKPLDYRNDLADTDEEDELDDGDNSAFNLAAATDDDPNPPKQLYQKWQGRASSSPTPSSMHLMLQRQQFSNTTPSPSSIPASSVSAPTVPLVSYTPSPGVDNSDNAYPYLPQQLHNYQHFDQHGRDHFYQHYHPQHHSQKRKPFPGGPASQSASSSPTSTPPKQSLLHSYQPTLPTSNANQRSSRPNSPARSPARSPAPSPARSPSASPETQLRHSHPTQTGGATGGRHVHHHHQHHQQRAPMPPHHLFSQASYPPHLHHHPHHQNLQQEIIDPIVNNSKPNNRSRSAGSTILASKIGRHHTETNTGHSANASPLIATAPAGLGPALQRKGGQESPTSPLSPNSSVQSSMSPMSPESPQHNYKRKGSKHAPQNHINNNANTSPTLPHKNKSNNGMHNGSKDNSNAGNPSGMNGKRNRNAGNASSPGNGVAANPGAVSGNGHHQHAHGGGSGGSSEDMSRFDLHLDKVQEGRDIRTTLMIKNIPNKYNQEMLLDTLNKFGYKGSFDFFYLPIDFKNKCNVGYAFINFIEASTVASFYQDFNQKKWEKFNSEKVCTITYARIQGKMAFIDHFRNSSLMYEDPACRPLIFHSGGPQVGTLEPFPPANVNPRIQRTQQQLTTNNTSIRPPTTPSTTPPAISYAPTSTGVPTPSVATVPSPHHTGEQATNVTSSSASGSTASEEG